MSEPVTKGLSNAPALTAIMGGLFAIAGAFLPWVMVVTAPGGRLTRTGMELGGDALVMILLGVLLVAMGLARRNRPPRNGARLATVIAGAFLVGLVAVEIGFILEAADAGVGIGTGLLAGGFGGLTGVASGLYRPKPG